MKRFVERHTAHVHSTLTGLDRVLFLGTIRSISYPDGLGRFLSSQGVLFKHFASFAAPLTAQIRADAKAAAATAGRPFVYLHSSATSKEERAREILAAQPVTEGLVCVFQCVEPCRGISFRKGENGFLVPIFHERRCSFLYYYFLDAELGLCHVRLQTWFPFQIQVCANGREWLACHLDREGIAYTKEGNCVSSIADPVRAQALMDELETMDWKPLLDRFAAKVNRYVGPDKLFGQGYYWTVRQSEVATDIHFDSAESLAAIYPHLVRHAIEAMSSSDVLRYLGRTTNSRFDGKVESHLKEGGRVEGVRVKHWVEENSIKMYDKGGSTLRIETTINAPQRLRVRRPQAGTGELASQAMRKGLSDWTRRQQVSRAANERYLDALAVVGDERPASGVLDPVLARIEVRGRPYRGLRPLDAREAAVYAAFLAGGGVLAGLSNRELRDRLGLPATTDAERRRSSAQVTRLLALLRAHRLIDKVPNRHRYRATAKGQDVMATALRLRAADMRPLAA